MAGVLKGSEGGQELTQKTFLLDPRRMWSTGRSGVERTRLHDQKKQLVEDAMATGEFNPLFESVRGAIGDIVVRHYGTRTVISRKPVFRNRVFSEAQK